jgi:hypothetical protein
MHRLRRRKRRGGKRVFPKGFFVDTMRVRLPPAALRFASLREDESAYTALRMEVFTLFEPAREGR